MIPNAYIFWLWKTSQIFKEAETNARHVNVQITEHVQFQTREDEFPFKAQEVKFKVIQCRLSMCLLIKVSRKRRIKTGDLGKCP